MNLLLLSGMPRSGSTYIQKFLATNNSVHNFQRTCPIPNYISFLKKAFEPGLDSVATTIEQTQIEFETFVKGGIDANCVSDKLNLFKSREFITHTNLLQRLYPNSKNIYIVRNLKDIVMSVYYSVHKYDYKDGYDNLSKSQKINFILENSFISGSLKRIEHDIGMIEDYKNNFYVLKYENFCSDVEKELEKISNFLNIENQFNLENINLDNKHIDTNYLHTVSHTLKNKQIEYKTYKGNFEDDVEKFLRQNFKNYYDYFSY